MAKFISYIRVSTQKQGDSGLGLEAQQEAVARHVGENTPIAEFKELESGKSAANRPQLMAALDLCKRKKAVLVVGKLDRLSRDVHFISGLLKSGVEFVACDNPHANKMTIQLLAVFAEHEREQISTRTKQALAAAKARGKKLGNPRWKESISRARLAKDPKPPAPAVVEMMWRHRAEGLSFRQIAEQLNALGLRTPDTRRNPEGCIWRAGTVRKAIVRCLFAQTTKTESYGMNSALVFDES
jgi:DNA invertase Pin-like site-specific DNA recombinase